jgi:hypothetical protein
MICRSRWRMTSSSILQYEWRKGLSGNAVLMEVIRHLRSQLLHTLRVQKKFVTHASWAVERLMERGRCCCERGWRKVLLCDVHTTDDARPGHTARYHAARSASGGYGRSLVMSLVHTPRSGVSIDRFERLSTVLRCAVHRAVSVTNESTVVQTRSRTF